MHRWRVWEHPLAGAIRSRGLAFPFCSSVPLRLQCSQRLVSQGATAPSGRRARRVSVGYRLRPGGGDIRNRAAIRAVDPEGENISDRVETRGIQQLVP